MDDKKKKKYMIPEVEIVDFSTEDIITSSLTRGGTLNWGEETDGEDWE